jgi:hypothetical protein
VLNLTPDQFWRYSLTEIYDLILGYNERYKEQRKLIAWHMANTMNVHLKKKDQVTINQLLGISRTMSKGEISTNVATAIEMLQKMKKERKEVKSDSNEYNSETNDSNWFGIQGNESWV